MRDRNVMILASAGSGKTWALTDRFIELLADGARPERIVALTFTRKAAGEFFDEILTKLAGAARDPRAAERLAAGVGRPSLGPADFLRMLRVVVDAMHRLRLGTIDSFFARIVRSFPLELGLAGDFDVLEEHSARVERQRALRRMFVGAGGAGTEAQRDFIEEFKRATFGTEEKRLGPRLDDFLDEHQEIFLAAPSAELWGNPARIWPQGNPWLGPAPDRREPARILREWLASAPLKARQRERWEAFLSAGETWAPGGTLAGEIGYVLDKALAAWPELVAGRAVLAFDRQRQELSAAASAALAALVRAIFAGELDRRLTATRGIHAILRGYETAYHDAVRRAGKLTFADVQRLLQPVALTGARAAEAPERLYIDFRLDAGIDHWLLDEFQDTSFGQWSILRNLIDEAVQDADGRRTFFCVGDVKQAIFAWREGDPRLFREIFNHYNAAAPGTIAEKRLVRSWRSGPPLIEMVNAVFGDKAVLGELFPGTAGAAWSAEWRPHESAVPQHGGQAALLHAADAASRWMVALRLLQEIRPLERGLTCVVLVQKNETAAELADFLRREGGMAAVAESDLRVCTDNPLGAALLALMQAAAHPGDRLAWEHVRMTPLREILTEDGLDDPAALSTHLLGRVHEQGFEPVVEAWLRRLDSRLSPGDRFTRERARQFAAAAGQFDRTGSRDLTEFIEFMAHHRVRDAESASAVRVMTIHKSKGLGFDLVLLPDLEGQTLFRQRDGLAVHKAPDRSVDWVLDLPAELFWLRDPVLAAHVEAAKAEQCYEKLSLLYVAMTRAKRAMYAIVKPVGSSQSANFPRLLSETLGAESRSVRVGGAVFDGAWHAGDPEWHTGLVAPEPEAAPAAGAALLDPKTVARAVRRPARRPSAEQTGPVPAGRLFALEETAAGFGDALHALFAEVEWWGGEWGAALEAALDRQGSRIPEGSAESSRVRLRQEVLACLAAPDLAGVWRKPAGGAAEAWRERAFEVVLDGAWITGKFDRVVAVRDPAGRVVRAAVFDFKTDRLEDGADLAAAAARHAGQLNWYRRAASVLTGLSLEEVSAEIVFTSLRRRVRV